MRPIATLDCETDPFKRGRIPKPFIWGLYDGDIFWYTEKKKELIERIKDEKIIIYAHNGGKFDYHYLLDDLTPYSELLIINGRIAKFRIGLAEMRDSFNIIPLALSKLQKDDFDYSLLESDVRHIQENWDKIVSYLESDCVNLYKFVIEFIERYGLNLTQAGTAMKQWQKISGQRAPRSDADYYEEISRFYYGGRVQCFQRGVIDNRFSVFDINSAYPRAMLERHPFGLSYHRVNGDIDNNVDYYASSFFTVKCVSRGAFPFRNDKGALTFPNDDLERTYNVTGWELQTARRTGTIENETVLETIYYDEFIDFDSYITYFFNERRAAQESGDKAGDVFSKLLMNSLYGKFGSNPDEYQSYQIIPHDDIGMIDGTDYEFSGDLGPWILIARDLEDEEKRFFNVAVAASITGYVRAFLWASICRTGVENMLYCDTDSIATRSDGSELDQGKLLGQWKHEGDFDKAGIGGKKLYIFRPVAENGRHPKNKYKVASKGARLTHAELWRIANGGKVTYRPENPTYSVHSGVHFVDRNLTMTY